MRKLISVRHMWHTAMRSAQDEQALCPHWNATSNCSVRQTLYASGCASTALAGTWISVIIFASLSSPFHLYYLFIFYFLMKLPGKSGCGINWRSGLNCAENPRILNPAMLAKKVWISRKLQSCVSIFFGRNDWNCVVSSEDLKIPKRVLPKKMKKYTNYYNCKIEISETFTDFVFLTVTIWRCSLQYIYNGVHVI
jgi:hypothetical protein